MTLGLPESEAANIDDAASMVHMMNANTFTGAAYRLKSGGSSGGILRGGKGECFGQAVDVRYAGYDGGN